MLADRIRQDINNAKCLLKDGMVISEALFGPSPREIVRATALDVLYSVIQQKEEEAVRLTDMEHPYTRAWKECLEDTIDKLKEAHEDLLYNRK